ncbi:Uncharacterised protein [Staphylococcus aureus]|nr:Uncharacterised protein [Staphylococcus aureus]
MEYAASVCPFGIEIIPPRIISEAYAPTFNDKPIIAATTGANVHWLSASFVNNLPNSGIP